MATHSSVLAQRIPWTEEPGRFAVWGCKSWTRLGGSTTTTSRAGSQQGDLRRQRVYEFGSQACVQRMDSDKLA